MIPGALGLPYFSLFAIRYERDLLAGGPGMVLAIRTLAALAMRWRAVAAGRHMVIPGALGLPYFSPLAIRDERDAPAGGPGMVLAIRTLAALAMRWRAVTAGRHMVIPGALGLLYFSPLAIRDERDALAPPWPRRGRPGRAAV